jgi:RNA polymerase sigma factor (sigma-70 family)
LLLRFDADSERAAQEYELMRSRLIKFFECRKCEVARDLTDETINRVARRISEGEMIPPNSLSAYFYGVARNILKEYRNRPEKNTYSLDLLEAAHHPVENPQTSNLLGAEKTLREQLLECLNSCVKKLPVKDQEIILIYYEGEYGAKIENRRKIAQVFGLNINNLRIRVYRIREKLESCVQLCRKKSASE